jgi:hypothetical protein
MKQLIITMTIFSCLLSNFADGQNLYNKKYKIVFTNYNDINPRITTIFSSDTMNVTLSKIADSLYSYKSDGMFNMDLQVDRRTKKAVYIEMKPLCTDDDESPKVERDTFQVKFIDNRVFEHGDYKYLVYRIFVINTKEKGSEMLIFWTKEVGVIMRKYLTGNCILRFEFADNEKGNEIVRHLCFMVFSNSNFSYLKDWEKLIDN